MRGVNTCVLTVRRSNLDAQPCRRSPHPGNRRVPLILRVDIACRAKKGDDSTAPRVHRRPIGGLRHRHRASSHFRNHRPTHCAPVSESWLPADEFARRRAASAHGSKLRRCGWRATGSELRQSRRKSLGAQRRSGFPRQFARAAEQPVQDQRPLDVTMQLVLGGEADTAQHLLAVPRGGQRRLAGRGLAEQASSSRRVSASQRPRRVASAPSMATSVSASRCRIAWNEAMGRPNCTRSTACWRASDNMARLAADQPPAHGACRPAAPRAAPDHPRAHGVSAVAVERRARTGRCAPRPPRSRPRTAAVRYRRPRARRRAARRR